MKVTEKIHAWYLMFCKIGGFYLQTIAAKV